MARTSEFVARLMWMALFIPLAAGLAFLLHAIWRELPDWLFLTIWLPLALVLLALTGLVVMGARARPGLGDVAAVIRMALKISSESATGNEQAKASTGITPDPRSLLQAIGKARGSIGSESHKLLSSCLTADGRFDPVRISAIEAELKALLSKIEDAQEP